MLAFIAWTAAMRAELVAANVAGGNVERDRDRPTRESDLPICLIAFEGDKAVADSHGGTGTPKFVHQARFVIAHFARAPNGPTLRTALYTAAETIIDRLLTTTATWGGEWLEGVEAVDTSFNLPPEGESVIGSVEIKITLRHRTIWPARLPDAGLPDLETVSVGIDLGDEDGPQPGITIAVPTQ